MFDKVSSDVYADKISPDHIVLRANSKKSQNSFKFMNLYKEEDNIGEYILKYGVNLECSYSNLTAAQREVSFEFEIVFLELDGKLEHFETL